MTIRVGRSVSTVRPAPSPAGGASSCVGVAMADHAPWIALTLAGAALEVVAVRRGRGTLTATTKAALHPERPVGALVLGFGLGWVAGHLQAGG